MIRKDYGKIIFKIKKNYKYIGYSDIVFCND